MQIDAVLLEERRQPQRGLTQLIFAPGREREDRLARMIRCGVPAASRFVVFHDDVCVRAARAEGTDPCAERTPYATHLFGLPLVEMAHDVERRILKIDQFVQLGAMQ